MAVSFKDIKTAYLSLGSNLGDRLNLLKQALAKLSTQEKIKLINISPLFCSDPREVKNQPEFFNVVTKLYTSLPPHELLEVCLEIENDLGRVRNIRYGPRSIDLDIIAMDGIIVDDPKLILPHPRYRQRRFVLEPLASLKPDFKDPITGEGVAMMLEKVQDQSVKEIGKLNIIKESPREK